MAITFSQSMAALAADSDRRSIGALVVAAVALTAWAGWFFFARVALYETTPTARLEVGRSSHALQAPVAGTVVSSRLVLDRSVEAGEVLVRLDTTSQDLELGEARARGDALQSHLASLRRSVAAEERALAVARSAGDAALKEARARLKEKRVQARYTDDTAKRLQRLRSGGQLSEIDYLKAEAQAEGNKAAVDTLRIAAARQRREQRTYEKDRQAEVEKLRADVTRTVGEIATVKAKIRRLEYAIEQRQIRAPVSGRLGRISKLARGAYVKEGESLATVVPKGTLTAVATYEPSAALGRIRRGQRARLRFHGFPWTQYGTVAATVSRVAREPQHERVRVELDVDPDPRSPIPLQHGLPAEAEVEVERVSPALLVLRAAGKLLTSANQRPSAIQPVAGQGRSDNRQPTR